ncbi:MAG: iron-containing alcohol dehydrogenase [Chloroflexota bacterium]
MDIPFQWPTRVRFGFGVSALAGEEARSLGGTRALVVTDPGVRGAGLLDGVLASLAAAGVASHVHDRVSGNPRDHECVAAADAGRAFGAQVVVAVGGGSPMDAAKTAAALLTNGGSPQDWEAPALLREDPLPIIAIPTTSGTGSEVTFYAVVTDTARRFKMSLLDTRIAPRVALVDPDLTMTMPPPVTASTGMDALTHAVEAFTGNLANPMADALAKEAIRLIAIHLAGAVRDGSNREARSGMMMASLLAGMAFGNTDVAAVHCLAEAIGGRYDTPHGVANSVFLPHVFAHNAEAFPARHAEVAAALGLDADGIPDEAAAVRAAGFIADLSREVGIPSLRALPGVDPVDFPALAEAAKRNVSDPSNRRPYEVADYLLMLRRAWDA